MQNNNECNSEKRKHKRIHVGIPARIAIADDINKSNEPKDITIKDLSSRGAKLFLDSELSAYVEIGGKIKLYICFVKSAGETVINATIRWMKIQDDGDFIVGVEYFDVSKENHKYIDHFFSGTMEDVLEINKKESQRLKKTTIKERRNKLLLITIAIIVGILLSVIIVIFKDKFLKKDTLKEKTYKKLSLAEKVIIENIDKSSKLSKETIKRLKEKFKDDQQQK